MKKLNIGCGEDIKKGYINIDFADFGQEIKHDLNKLPLPFKKNTFKEIYAKCILEHLNTNNNYQVRFLEELYRISKNKGIIKIIVPFGDQWKRNLQHTSGYDYYTFIKLCREKKGNERCTFLTNKKFNLIKMKNVPTKIGRFIPNFKCYKGTLHTYTFRELLSHFFNVLIQGLYIELEVIK